MAKNTIRDWSVTANSNTDVGGIGIQGSNLVSNFDGGMRTIMKQVADANTGAEPVSDTWSFGDPADPTKKVRFDAGNVAAGQTRMLQMPNADVSLSAFSATYLNQATEADTLDALGLRVQVSLSFNLYVNTSTGNDANDGLTALTPFKTITQAIKTAYSDIDQRAAGVTINVADGTYAETLYFYGPPVWSSGPTSGLVYPIRILGNSTTPGNVVITNDADGGPVRMRSGAVVYFEGVKLTSGTTGSTAFDIQDKGTVLLASKVEFGAFAGGNHWLANNGGTIYILGNWTVSGGAATHLHSTEESLIRVFNSPTCTITGTPAFSNFFAGVAKSTLYARGITFSGSATGQRYFVHKGGLIDTNLAGINYFPGNVAGQAINGGNYDDMQLGRAISFAQPGYVLHDNGLWEMWGFSTFNNENSVSFPTTFPTNCFGVIATPAIAPPSNGAYFVQVSSISNSGFTASGRQFSGGSVSTAGISASWYAWGN